MNLKQAKNNNDMALPLTGVSVSLVRSTLGASTNDVGLLCTHPNINRWSKKTVYRQCYHADKA